MSWVSKATGGGGGGVLGNIMTGGLSGLASMLGGSLFPGAPQVPGMNIMGQNPGDQKAIQDLIGKLNPMFQQESQGVRDLYGQQATQENQGIDKAMQDMITNLTTGTQGEGLREKYNNLGLLNSGAFNQGLANQFTPIQQQAQQNVLQQGQQEFGDLRNILNQQTGMQTGLNESGLQRQFGLEDAQTNATLQQMIANAQLKQQYRQGNMDFLGNLIGGGMNLAGSMMGG